MKNSKFCKILSLYTAICLFLGNLSAQSMLNKPDFHEEFLHYFYCKGEDAAKNYLENNIDNISAINEDDLGLCDSLLLSPNIKTKLVNISKQNKIDYRKFLEDEEAFKMLIDIETIAGLDQFIRTNNFYYDIDTIYIKNFLIDLLNDESNYSKILNCDYNNLNLLLLHQARYSYFLKYFPLNLLVKLRDKNLLSAYHLAYMVDQHFQIFKKKEYYYSIIEPNNTLFLYDSIKDVDVRRKQIGLMPLMDDFVMCLKEPEIIDKTMK